jgi:hypothetical protein
MPVKVKYNYKILYGAIQVPMKIKKEGFAPSGRIFSPRAAGRPGQGLFPYRIPGKSCRFLFAAAFS